MHTDKHRATLRSFLLLERAGDGRLLGSEEQQDRVRKQARHVVRVDPSQALAHVALGELARAAGVTQWKATTSFVPESTA